MSEENLAAMEPTPETTDAPQEVVAKTEDPALGEAAPRVETAPPAEPVASGEAGEPEPPAEPSVEPPGEQAVEPPGEQSVDLPGEQSVDAPGEQSVEPAGEQSVEPAGEQPVEAPGAQSVEPAGEPSLEPQGEAPVKPPVEDSPRDDAASAEPAAPVDERAETPADDKPAKRAAPPRAPEAAPVAALRRAMEADEPVDGKVIGWNNGGFHVVVGGMTAFCPRSEIEIDAPKAPETYLDQELSFRVLKVQRGGKRIVLSRSAHLKNERRVVRAKVKENITAGTVRSGRVASITDFGAFVDLDGVQGLVHISELSRRRVEHPSEVVEAGQEVEVKVLRVESDGKRISLSMKALEPDPWEGVKGRFEEGSLVTGTVERTADFGAFISVAPGLTGLLPTSVMGLPRGASAAKMFSPGKEVVVQIQSVDPRRRRISLSLEGSTTEGSRKDFESYRREQTTAEGGFNALAAALEKIRRDGD